MIITTKPYLKGNGDNMMTIRDEVNRQIKHIEAKIINMEGYNPYKTKESIDASYWCGAQAATTTLDFVDTLYSMGLITSEENNEYYLRIANLRNLLTKTHNAMAK